MANAANPVLLLVRRMLAWSARAGSVLLAVGIFGGVASPALAHSMRDFVTPNVFCMMTLVLLRVDLPGTLAHLRRPGRVAALVLFQLVASPLVAWLAVSAVGLERGIADGVVIFATGCAATSSPAFARMVGLDPELSLIGALATTALVPLTAPPLALWLMGIDLSIGAAAFAGRLVLLVGLPMLLSLALRQLIGPARLAEWGEAVDGLLVWLVVFYGFAVMDGLAGRAAADMGWVMRAVAAAFVANYGLNLLGTAAFMRLGARTAATAGLMAGNRNMALFLAVLPGSTDPKILLFLGLSQFPLFLSPFMLRPAYRWLLSGRPADGQSRR